MLASSRMTGLAQYSTPEYSKYHQKKQDTPHPRIKSKQKRRTSCSCNPQFYRYHPPMATKASILDDLQAVPPGKTLSDKCFIGFYDGETLAAMMDLITGYPNPATAFIGLFMVDAAQQGRGTGSALIADCKQALRAEQFKTLRLAIDEGNPQSKAFWQKNGFALTGQRTPNENGAYLPMECEL